MADPVMAEEFPDEDRRTAVCYSQWRGKEKQMDPLLKAIRDRQRRKTPFGYGIRTADVYVRTLAERAGLEACYNIASTRSTSFDDVMQKAAETLVYSNEDMGLEEKITSAGDFKRMLPADVELPKNTLMVFRHKLTTSREDRDGDVLHSNGMELDPKMLLLWQHVHTMPIGKMLHVAEQNDKEVRCVSAVVDMNETTHDAAVMIDNGMGRFSHGFRSIEHEKRKDKNGGELGGFEIFKAEIMESSLVSVPANVDADTEEVLLSLVEGGKLTSPMMKAVGKSIREHRPVTVGGTTIKFREKLGNYQRELACGSLQDLKAAADAGLIGTKEDHDEDEPGTGKGTGTGGGEEAPAAASEKANAEGERPAQEGEAGDDQVNECPKCGAELPAKLPEKCPECGAELPPPKKSKAMSGSFEHLQQKLSEAAYKHFGNDDHWVFIRATFPDKIIVDVDSSPAGIPKCYEIGWKIEGDEVELVPPAKEVNITEVVSSKSFDEKAGRIISGANEKRLREALEDLVEFAKLFEDMGNEAKTLVKQAVDELKSVLDTLDKKGGKILSATNEAKVRKAVESLKKLSSMGLEMTRSAKALLKDALAEIMEVLGNLGPKEESTAKSAGVEFLSLATIDEMKTMRDALSTMIDVDQRTEKTKRISRLFGRDRLAASGSRRS